MLGLEAELKLAPVPPARDCGWHLVSVLAHMGSPAENPMGIGWFGMAMGLGLCCRSVLVHDFLVVQRAMVANSMSAARRTP